VEWTIPGKFLYYATAMPSAHQRDSAYRNDCGRTPDQARRQSAASGKWRRDRHFRQASILDLYDPSRSQRFVHKEKKSDRAAFDAYIGKLRNALLTQQGEGVAFLVTETHSPTRERLRAELEKILPGLRWCVYEPLLSQEQSSAAQGVFGGSVRVLPRFDRADVILALDSDFLDCGQGDLASVRAFTSRRRVSAPKDNMNRLYVVENRFTLTGAMADHRLRCPASQIAAFAHALAGRFWRN
jgi:molybdopterin-containing oxidoreductase family iron-sulfur binding subunit